MITINNRELHSLVKPVLHLASDDDYLPAINSVMLRRQGHWLLAAATDRYRVGVKRIRLAEDTPEGEFYATVPVKEIAQVLSLFKPTRASWLKQPRLTMQVVDDLLEVKAIPSKKTEERHELAALEIGCRTISGAPDIFKLVAESLNEEPAEVPFDTVALNADLIAGFKDSVRHCDTWGTKQILLKHGKEPSKPLVIHAGDDFVGLIMPQRIQMSGKGRVTPDTKALDAGWTDLLTGVSAVEESKRKALTKAGAR